MWSTWRSHRYQRLYDAQPSLDPKKGERWTAPVSKSLEIIKATCSTIEDKLEKGPQYQQLIARLSHYTKRIATMRTAYEYLATLSMSAQSKSKYVVIHGGQL